MAPQEILIADRSERGKLRFTGPQRAWFLHQILTQSFEDMSPGEARDTALLTPHGRMLGYLEALAVEDAILCHFEPELRDSLPEAIGRYVFATQVEIEDVTDDMGLVLVVGESWMRAAMSANATAPVQPTAGLGVEAGYMWTSRAEVPEVVHALELAGAAVASEDELERIRIGNGVPRWGRDMGPKTIPQEAGIEERAVHFAKGCYLGQEAMAKIQLRGKVNRHLRRLEARVPIAAGAEVTAHGEVVGTVTSAADGIALAMLRHTVEPGAEVRVGDVVAKIVA